jgi:2-polyprenyl-6-hydroxyphenyl methylase/3-demethylubiquinone-9 3-methyltransferase
VLHHTGDMWAALANVDPLVAPHGQLFIALYNDQGGTSRRWTKVKKLYNAAPRLLRPLVALMVYIPIEAWDFLRHVLARKPHVYLSYIVNYKRQTRGMSWWHDKIDWIGGYPFEVAKPEEVFEFYQSRGYGLRKLKTLAGGLGCNEFVFEREAATSVRPQAPSQASGQADDPYLGSRHALGGA